ncbi:LOW QUALITY PROTEIN: eukaryotic translation initiation factor 3 subunit C-like [Amphiura filiformis]|uniref:LOW QUALITY PROTEIN: eukaryotic translation initiation factor 3 subunit C-like n=1 Tax=Amphiura filiformis TaxID=82378 RepID=UPI003B22786F
MVRPIVFLISWDFGTRYCIIEPWCNLGFVHCHGNIKDAHNALLDIQSGGRAKELLAQGLLMQRHQERDPKQEKIEKSRQLPFHMHINLECWNALSGVSHVGLLMQRHQERDPKQEKIEKSRQLPFHMHINLELLECVYLVSAMLLEIPYMASHHFDIRRRMISIKSFHHQLRLSERQTLVGPPESMREHVVAASRAMRYGDWKACKNFLINDKMNVKVWNLFQESDHVRNLIVRKIQEESLRTYLFTYGSVYDSMSLITLSEMFELEGTVVHSIISKMIINEELMASWDEPAATIVMHRCEPTQLQNLALRLSDKVNNLIDNNERLLEYRQGGGGYQKGDRDNRGGRDDRRGGYGRGNYRDRQGDRDNRGGRDDRRGGGYNRREGGNYRDRQGGGNYRDRQGGGRGRDNRNRGGYGGGRDGGGRGRRDGDDRRDGGRRRPQQY